MRKLAPNESRIGVNGRRFLIVPEGQMRGPDGLTVPDTLLVAADAWSVRRNRERAAKWGIDADALGGFRISPEAAASGDAISAIVERQVVVLIEAGVADDAPQPR
jgi:hypothetical protein